MSESIKKIRLEYIKETGKLNTQNVRDYAVWLENRLADLLSKPAILWRPHDYEKRETHPTEDGCYLVQLKDGTIRLHNWHSFFWVGGYNSDIVYYSKINPQYKQAQ